MTKSERARYTVRLVESGQSMAVAARTLGVVEQTLFNWVKAHREGTLTGAVMWLGSKFESVQYG
jgi:transposase